MQILIRVLCTANKKFTALHWYAMLESRSEKTRGLSYTCIVTIIVKEKEHINFK